MKTLVSKVMIALCAVSLVFASSACGGGGCGGKKKKKDAPAPAPASVPK